MVSKFWIKQATRHEIICDTINKFLGTVVHHSSSLYLAHKQRLNRNHQALQPQNCTTYAVPASNVRLYNTTNNKLKLDFIFEPSLHTIQCFLWYIVDRTKVTLTQYNLDWNIQFFGHIKVWLHFFLCGEGV